MTDPCFFNPQSNGQLGYVVEAGLLSDYIFKLYA